MKTTIKFIRRLHFKSQKLKATKNTLGKCLVLIVLMQSFVSFSLFAQDNTDSILAAYEHRMNGNVEMAKAIINKVLENDPTNALAHFEMARTVKDQRKSYHIEKALLYDSENLMFRFFQANLHMLDAYKAMKKNETEIINQRFSFFAI